MPAPGHTDTALADRVHVTRAGWLRWRRSRPFWGGLFTLAGGLTIVWLPANQYTVLALPGIAGLAGFLLGGLCIALGLMLWFHPAQRTFAGSMIVLCALASFVYTNFGGFLIGMILTLLGGGLGFAWKTTEGVSPHADSTPTVSRRANTDSDDG
jgi:hypothetical protein